MADAEELVNEAKGIKSQDWTKKLRENPWIVSTAVFGVVAVILLYMSFSGGITGNVISEKSAEEKIIPYLNSLTGGGVTLINSKDMGNLYEIQVSYQAKTIPVYITKDGNYFVSSISPITGNAVTDTNTQTQQQPTSVPKTDKPEVELFVMTYCPYGLQAEKALIPAIQALRNKVDATVRFVHYFMHGDKEEQETYNQICIREGQSAKYLDYLSCFSQDGDSARCITKVGIDKTKLDSCVANKAKDYYAKDSKLSQDYGVQGSPTLIINGVEASFDRSSSGALNAICSAFTGAPGECNTKLSSTPASSGFGGVEGGETATGGSCG